MKDEKVQRRGFLKLMGAVSLLPAAAKALLGEDELVKEKSGERVEEVKAFKYQCACGDEMMAPVPKKMGTQIDLDCSGCGCVYRLTWNGDCFRVRIVRAVVK